MAMTYQQRESLIQKIYDTLMLSPYVVDGEVCERGMGEMGEARDEAARIVDEWLDENKVIEGEDKLHTKDELQYAYECATDMEPSYTSFTDFYNKNHLTKK